MNRINDRCRRKEIVPGRISLGRKLFFFLFVASILNSFHLRAQKPDLQFKHINTKQGLSHVHVRSIVKDHLGFMWFGSTFGLNKYDGNKIKVYFNIPKDSSSLNDNDVKFLYEDSRNNLWIATRNGLNRFNREKDNFIRIPEIGTNVISVLYEDRGKNLWAAAGTLLYLYFPDEEKFKLYTDCGSRIRDICEDSKGNFWIGTDNLHIFDKENKILKSYKGLKVSNINGLWEDRDHTLWILAYQDGVYTLNLDTRQIKKYAEDSNDPKALATNTVTCINEDKDGNIWIGSLHKGLMIFDKKKEVFYNYLSIAGDDESLGFNSIKCILRDKDAMWIGTYSSGVDYITERKFTHLYSNVLDRNGLNNNSIIALSENKDGELLIGTDGGGLNIYNKETGSFTYYKHDNENRNTIGSNIVSAVVEDNRGDLWVGCWDGGVSLISKGKVVRHFTNEPSNPDHSLLDNSILYLYEGKDNKIWVGTLFGLSSIDKDTYKVDRYDLEVKDLKNYINCMLQDEMGNFWVGTWGGLTILDKEKKTYKRFLPNENDSTTISDDKIFALFVDSKGRFWIGTAGGLNLCNRADNTFRAFRVKDGLPSDAIYGILEDNQGNLWLSTANGLSKFNPDKKIFKNYFSDDGLQSNQFKEHAYVRLKSGEMAFGGVNGVNIFNPQNIRDNTFVPPVVITDFRIFNQSVPISKRSILRQDISITKEITLSYSQSVISFDFAALNYEVPEKNQYAYMMEGFEQKWNYVQDQKNATYTNLDPGEYIFKVKASNNDGVWNQKGTYLKIIIKPPFWKTWWFNTLCIIGLILLVFSIILYRDSKIKEQKKELERQVKERTSEIVQKNEELEAQTENLRTANNEIREKEQKLNIIYNEIRDNIRAAEVIQKYILPSQDYIKKHLCESFILYKPKDVVSGDFYWFDQLHGKKIIAVADCTGHGVSGAFMSINGHHLLNQAIFSNNFSTASDILDRLNEGVVKEFHKAYRETDFKDGMDVSLCIIDEQNLKLQFSGANHPLYLLRDNEIIQVKGNRFSIGTIIRNQIGKFSNHIIDLRKGDLVYLFSDGYADQIGGENGEEKFMYPRFRELLLEISHLRMNEQQNILSEQFESWKGRNSQLDDVLVIGFKI